MLHLLVTVGEIGVQHGKFFLPLVGFSAPGEAALAVDLFELQQDNVDQSGLAARPIPSMCGVDMDHLEAHTAVDLYALI